MTLKAGASKNRPELITGDQAIIKERLEQVRVKRKLEKQWRDLGVEKFVGGDLCKKNLTQRK